MRFCVHEYLQGPALLLPVPRYSPFWSASAVFGPYKARCLAQLADSLCQIPTQEYFTEDIGLPLTMKPDYEDYSCTLTFGATAPPPSLDPAFATPCLQGCPERVDVPVCSRLVSAAVERPPAAGFSAR